MVIQSSVVKATARATWENNKMFSFAVGLALLFSGLTVYMFFQLIAMFLPLYVAISLFSILLFFWLLPFTLGVLRVIWQQMLQSHSHFTDIFYYFSGIQLYKKTIEFLFFLIIRVVGIVFVCILPAMAVNIVSSEWIHTTFEWEMPLWISNLSVISSILYFLGGIVSLFFIIRFYVSLFLFVADDDMDALEAIHLSTVISKDSLWELFVLVLSFIGWFIIGIFVFPLFYVIPYFATSFMVHCRFVVAGYNKRIEIIKKYSSVEMNYR